MEKTPTLVVSSPNIKYTDEYIYSDYEYEETLVTRNGEEITARPIRKTLGIRTDRRVGKVGVMLVGWGGNNGSTFTAAVLANRHQLSWNTKNGKMDSNWWGSITQASTVRLGIDEKGCDVHVPMCQLLPMVHPDDLVIDGWDISPMNLAESMVRAKVIDYDLQQKLKKEMAAMKPRPAIYDPDFIAANQMQGLVSDKTFHLKWNNHLQNLSQLFTTIYSSSALADVTLSCRDGTLKAHKLVLSACSPYFEQIFKDNPCQHPIVILKGIPFSEINLLVEFMYKGSVDVQELDLQSLMHTASELEIRGLAYEARDNAAQMLNVNLEYPSYPATSVSAQPAYSQARTDVERLKQADRATNLIRGTKYEQYLQVRADIKDFRDKNKLDKIIVLWTANTERFCEVRAGVHDTSENIERALRDNNSEISPSTIFALAAIDENCIYINGSPQNTLVGGVVERAEMRGVFVAGDDFKSGQTKLKSVLVDFLVSAGLKPVSIVSYNHLGNNDGKNLSAPKQFRSKEITKSNVVDDMVESNQVLYKPGEKPDHVVVIKYVPYVGDSKRAMDEYTSEILLHGTNTIVVHNTCEDSLLAVPLILDLVLLADLFSRFAFRETDNSYVRLHAVLSPLAYLLKAPLVASGAPVVNALFKQRANIDNLLRAALALPPNNNLGLEHKVPFLMKELHSGALFNSPPNKKQKLTHENGDQ